jgi:hypothetical protein
MAFSQDSTSFQPSGLFSKILACFRWPLAQFVSKVCLDTSIPTIESLTSCYHDRRWTQQGSAQGSLVRGISGLPRFWMPFGMNSGARSSGAISTAQGLRPKGRMRLTAFLAASAGYCCPPNKLQRTYGRSLLTAPRTDPSEQDSRTWLLPRVFDGELHHRRTGQQVYLLPPIGLTSQKRGVAISGTSEQPKLHRRFCQLSCHRV